MQAMLLAAGKGTRLKPLTDIIPKALVPVAGKPLLQQVMQRLTDAGADNVVVNVHHHAEQIRNFLQLLRLAMPGVQVSVSDETQELLETGGGIKRAQMLFRREEPVVIHNCDILSNLNIGNFYCECLSLSADAVLLVSRRQTQRYLLFDDAMRLVGWTNIATGQVRSPHKEILSLDGRQDADWSRLGVRLFAFSGIHCLSPVLFELMDDWPDRFPIMDFYLKHCADRNIRGIAKDDLKLLDVGKLDTLAAADEFAKSVISPQNP